MKPRIASLVPSATQTLAATLCPQARVQLVDGELLSWWGARGAAGLEYLQRLAAAPDQPPVAP